METPMPVAVVRPVRSWRDVIATLVVGVLWTLAVAWVLMLIIGELIDPGFSYTRTLLLLCGARLLQREPNITLWTHRAKGSAL